MKRRKFIFIVTLLFMCFLSGILCRFVKSNLHSSSSIFNTISNLVKKNPNVSIQGQAAVVIDEESGKVLYYKNKDMRMYPASTTKLMTALLFSQNMNRNSILRYSSNAKRQEPSKLNLPLESRMNGDNAMRAMLVFSANDIAYMIGENVSGSSERFASLMNEKAKELGMKNTHFANPNGLPDENHYTTAYDLSLLAREDYKNDWIMSDLGLKSTYVKTLNNHGYVLYTTNKLLGQDGCIAGKTGYTNEAGRCLVAYFKKGDKVLIGVILKDKDDDSLYQDMKKIISACS